MSAYDWDPLKNTVQGAIDRGQIGRPAALRMTVHAAGGPAEQKNWHLPCAVSQNRGLAIPASLSTRSAAKEPLP